jgi:glycosyltransferase involved in cell wall biosynthesis
VRVLVVAEYYPRAGDPARGVWAHRQALAVREAGAEVRVLVLHRPLPPLAALRRLDRTAIARELRQPRETVLDGIPIRYVRYVSPPRPLSYGTWGAWAAPALRRAIAKLRQTYEFDLLHAHYAVPAGDAVRRVAPEVPLVVSVHGGDVYRVAGRPAGARAVRRTLAHARLVLANSAGTERRCRAHGAARTCVVHLGTDLPPETAPMKGAAAMTDTAPIKGRPARLVTVANLVARKRHDDVLRALALLRDRDDPRLGELEYVIVGDGPERRRLEVLARSLRIGERVRFLGALPHADAIIAARDADLFVLPSLDEAFGVAYVEAMAAGVPAIGSRGEDGPEEIAAAGGGMVLVPPRDPVALADAIASLIEEGSARAELGRRARTTVAGSFTWKICGASTLDAYITALRGV